MGHYKIIEEGYHLTCYLGGGRRMLLCVAEQVFLPGEVWSMRNTEIHQRGEGWPEGRETSLCLHFPWLALARNFYLIILVQKEKERADKRLPCSFRESGPVTWPWRASSMAFRSWCWTTFPVLVSFGFIPRSGTTESHGHFILHFLSNLRIDFHSGWTNLQSPNSTAH